MPRASLTYVAYRQTQHRRGTSETSTTIPLFDVFRVGDSGQPRRLASLRTLEEAKARVAMLGEAKPGEYFVFSQLSLLSESIKVERH
jgi:hypothetical protein